MEVIKCKFFMISKLTKRHWYFLLFLIGSFFRIFVVDLLDYISDRKKNLIKISNDSNQQLKNLNILLTQRYFDIIRAICSDLILGFFHCYYMIMYKENYKKRTQQTYNKNSQKISFIFNDETRRVPRIFKLIFIISLVDIICQLSFPIKYIIEYFIGNGFLITDPNHLYFLLVIDIYARYFFSRWILTTYFYAHHKLSFLFTTIGLVALGFVDIKIKFINQDEKKYDLLFIIIISIQYIFYSLEDIMNKVAFQTLYLFPNTLIFYKGLFQLVCYFPIITITLFTLRYFNIFSFEEFNSVYEIRKFFCFVPFNALRTIFLVKVIDKFSAQHMAFLRVFETIIIFVYNKIKISLSIDEKDNDFFDYKTWELIIQIIAFIIILISSLIHNELIIINIPKLKAKTEYYLDKDADNEQNTSYYSDTLFSDSKNETSNTVTNLYSDMTGSDMS